MLLSVNYLRQTKQIRTTTSFLEQLCPQSTVVIRPGIHMWRRLKQLGWSDDTHRAPLEDMDVDHPGVDVRVTHQILNGSDVLLGLQQMGCKRIGLLRQPAGLVKTGTLVGLLHSLLHHAWIQMMAAFFSNCGIPPAIPLGKDPLRTPIPLSASIFFRPTHARRGPEYNVQRSLQRLPFLTIHSLGSAPPSGVTQEVLWPSLEGEQEQSGDDCLEANCSAPFIHYEP